MATGRGKGESQSSVRRVNAAERQRQALELRKAGASYPAIAQQLGYRSASGAHDAVKSALTKMLQEPADKVRELEVARLDALLMAVWTDATRVGGASLEALDRALKIMARRAALLGLDAPKEVVLTWEKVFKDAGLDHNAIFQEIVNDARRNKLAESAAVEQPPDRGGAGNGKVG